MRSGPGLQGRAPSSRGKTRMHNRGDCFISSYPHFLFFGFFYPRLAGEFSSEKGHAFVEQLHKVSIDTNPHSVQSLGQRYHIVLVNLLILGTAGIQ